MAAGLDPNALGQIEAVKMDFGARDESGKQVKAWRDVWGSGQGIGAVKAVVPAAELGDRLAQEYGEALHPTRRFRLAV